MMKKCNRNVILLRGIFLLLDSLRLVVSWPIRWSFVSTAWIELVPTPRVLLNSALSSGTRKIYQRAWATFSKFYKKNYHSVDPVLPLTTSSLTLFISYLHARKLAPSTIKSYFSAMGYVHKMKGVRDPTKVSYRQVVNSPRSSAFNWHPVTNLNASAPLAPWLTAANQLFPLSTHRFLRYVLNGFLWLLSHR